MKYYDYMSWSSEHIGDQSRPNCVVSFNHLDKLGLLIPLGNWQFSKQKTGILG